MNDVMARRARRDARSARVFAVLYTVVAISYGGISAWYAIEGNVLFAVGWAVCCVGFLVVAGLNLATARTWVKTAELHEAGVRLK